MIGSSVQIPGGVAGVMQLQAGTHRAADIEAAIARGVVVQCGPGDFVLTDRQLQITPSHSHGRLLGLTAGTKRLTNIVRGYAKPDVSQASVDTNALMTVRGALDLTLCDTTMGATPAGTRSRTLVAAVAQSLPKDAYLVVSGSNATGTDEQQMSDGTSILVTEIVQLLSTTSSSTTIPLARPTQVHHSNGAGITIQGVHPVVDFVVSGINFVGDADTIGNGIFAEYAVDCWFDIAGAGFTIAVLTARNGCRGCELDLLDRGGGNGGLYLDSCHSWRCAQIVAVPGPTRYATSDGTTAGTPVGAPKAKLKLRNRCAQNHFGLVDLEGGVQGICGWGMQHCTFSSTKIHDMDATAILPLGNGGLGLDPEMTAPFGAGVDLGSGPLAVAAFGVDVQFGTVQISDCGDSGDPNTGGAVGNTFGFFFHDTYFCCMGQATIANNGLGSYTGPQYMSGINFVDCSGAIANLEIRGCLYAIQTGNVTPVVHLPDVQIDGTPGIGSSISQIRIQHGGGNGSSPRFGRLHMGNCSNAIRFGGGFTGSGIDWQNMTIEVMQSDLITEMRRVELFNNATAAAAHEGEVWTVQNTTAAAVGGERRIVASGVSDTGDVVVIAVGGTHDVGTGLVMAALGDCYAQISVACNPGDQLVTDGSAKFKVDNAATGAAVKAIAMQKLTSAGTAKIRRAWP